MEDKKKVSFPKGFFTKDRPTITNKEALKDVIPVKWSEEVKDDKKKTIIYSNKEKKYYSNYYYILSKVFKRKGTALSFVF